MSSIENPRITVRATAVCPYCGYQNEWPVKVSSYDTDNRFFLYCDCEDGGCDELIAVQVSVRTLTTAFKLVKEGE